MLNRNKRLQLCVQHNTDPLVGIIGHHYNGIPVLMIVLGSLVCVFGLVGSIGGIFVQYLCGRIILRVVR